MQAVSIKEARASGRRRRRDVLVAALAEKGLTQAGLVHRLHLAGEKTANTTVNGWCTGRTEIDGDTLGEILRLLGLPADWQPTPPPPTTH